MTVFDLAQRVMSALLALALMLGGLVVAAEIMVAGFGRQPWLVPHDRWWQWAATTGWSDPGARLVFAGLLVTGMVLVALAWWRRPPSSLALASGAGGVAAEVDRRDLERWLVERMARVDGVSQARIEVGTRTVRVSIVSVGGDGNGVERRTREAVERQLEALALARPLPVRVDTRSGRVA